jgi:hypothetical protein
MRDDIYDTRPEPVGYGLPDRITRDWVPKWLWHVFCWHDLATWEPFKHILTRKPTQADIDAIEALGALLQGLEVAKCGKCGGTGQIPEGACDMCAGAGWLDRAGTPSFEKPPLVDPEGQVAVAADAACEEPQDHETLIREREDQRERALEAGREVDELEDRLSTALERERAARERPKDSGMRIEGEVDP